MNKFWSIVFGAVMLACGLSFVVAPAMGWWLPEGVSSHSDEVDQLFYVILFITGFFFFLTEAILVVFLFVYSSEGPPKPARAAGWPWALKPLESVLHDSHRVEMAWTLIPAIILLYIAFAQIGSWARIKYQRNIPEFGKRDGDKLVVPVQLDVSARQFEWRVRYPSHERFTQWLKAEASDAGDFNSFAKNRQADDVELVNEVHTWVDEPTVVYLSTRDVIHSFNIPMMRVKQDALPGKVIPVWFRATKANASWDEAKNVSVLKEVWDLPCAELCGWGHYRMIGRVYVYPSQDEFLKWLSKADADAHVRSGPR